VEHQLAGGKMKKAGLEHWNSPNTGATNESGFTALPAGYRDNPDGNYNLMGNYGYFWSSTYPWLRRLNHSSSGVFRLDYFDMHYGFSVRCLKD
jgi:uncharacterized protein (TIGR02145 family)